VIMMRTFFLGIALCLSVLAVPAPVAAAVAYVVEWDDEEETSILWAEVGEERHELARARSLWIEQEADFDRDGTTDVLVGSSEGGNCCPEDMAIHSLVDGQPLQVAFVTEWASTRVVPRGDGLAIERKTNEETTIYAFAAGRLVVLETIPKLAAIKEIYGLGAAYEGEQQYQLFEVDLDDDGVPEAIRCNHWARWGSMLCALPRPGREAQEMSLGCDRVGLLAGKSSGYHQLVCNNDALFVFDGHDWAVSDVPTERLAERIRELEGVLGGFPPRIADAVGHAAATRSYGEIATELDAIIARQGEAKHLRDPHLLFLRGSLLAMGHALDRQRASDDLRAVLAKTPDHVPSLLTLGRLWVNSRPELAPDAEQLFRDAQCSFGKQPLEDAQRGLFFALSYQGKMEQAFRQARYLAATWPRNPQYQALVDTARSVVERTVPEAVAGEIPDTPLGVKDCKE